MELSRCAVLRLHVVAVLFAAVHSFDPKPNPKSVVQLGQARFTLLTSHLIRMEWGGSNDQATFAFINRNTPTPPYNTSKDGDWTIIQTPDVKIRYLPSNETFSPDNLQVSIQLNGQTVSWSPGPTANATLNGNLLGTIRSLDTVNGSAELNCLKQTNPATHCQLGLVSTAGYVVVDDTNHPQFDQSGWPWVVNQTFPQPSQSACSKIEPEKRRGCGFPGIGLFDCIGKGCCHDGSSVEDGIPTCYYTYSSYQDLYFFGHGHNYKQALKEFTMIAGKIPLPPRYAFGSFYSRYHAYNDIGAMEIIKGYKKHGVPLDVLVLDMDWHITFYKEAAEGKKDQAGQRIGWSGFTWDSHLFPNPSQFLTWVKSKGIKVTLNVHPASGIQPWEDKYTEMAEAMGIDPKTKKYVRFVPSDKKFVTNWMDIVMGAREQEGVDFWWLDWGQGETWIKIPLVNPTFWLNYIFFTDPHHWNMTTPAPRPLILHRWGGLGNHRYQVGFSGDVWPSWPSLDFQVYFTITATNVAFGYWSHDIGGHKAPVAAELYTRWVQWGIFSPIFRPHCEKTGDDVRRIWLYPPENYDIMKDAILLREAMVPYIYSNARYAYDEGLSLLRPMYYNFPESTEAYKFNKQYMFGPDILVAPVTEPVNKTTQMATKQLWIPKGTYISWFGGESVTGPKVINKTFTLSEIPVYVRAGAIIAMRTDTFAEDPIGSAQEIPTQLKFMVFVGNVKSGSTHLYEDDGNSTQYMEGVHGNTTVQYTWDSTQYTLSVTVGPTTGQFPGLPSSRAYQIVVPNFWPGNKVTVEGHELPYVMFEESFASYTQDSWTYDGSTLSLVVNIVNSRPVTNQVKVVVSYATYKEFDPYWFAGFAGRLGRLQQAKETLDNQWKIDTVYQEDYTGLLNATEIGVRVTRDPLNIHNLTSKFPTYLHEAIEEVKRLHIFEDVKQMILAQISTL